MMPSISGHCTGAESLVKLMRAEFVTVPPQCEVQSLTVGIHGSIVILLPRLLHSDICLFI